MKVRFIHNKCYDWETVEHDNVLQTVHVDYAIDENGDQRLELQPKDRVLSEDETGAQVDRQLNVDDVLGTNAKGEVVRRIGLDSPYTETTFAGGALDTIHDDRDAAGLSRKTDYQIIAHHLEDAVIPTHFNLNDVTDIICEEDQELADFLKMYFQINQQTGVPTNDTTNQTV